MAIILKKIATYSLRHCEPYAFYKARQSISIWIASQKALAMTRQVTTKTALILMLLVLPGIAFATTKKPLIVVLDWFINPNHAPLIITQQLGFFKQQGLEVIFIPPADASEGEKMVITDRADITVTYQPALIYKTAQGLPLIRFATLINAPLSCLIVLDNSLINSLNDLKNKKIGISTRNTESIVLATMLRKFNLTFKDIIPINVKFNLTQSLLSHKIDAFTGGMRNFEPNMIKLAGKKAKVFYPEQHGFPMYDELILVANKNKINNPDLIKFIKALRQGIDYLIKNPDTCWQIFVKLHPELNNKLNHDAWFFTLPYFARNPGMLDKDRYQNLANFMHKEKLITSLPELHNYAIGLQ